MEALLVLVLVLVVMVVMVVVMVVMMVVMVDSIEVVGTQLSGGGRRESFEEIRANKWQPWRKSGLTRTRRASLGLYCAPFQSPFALACLPLPPLWQNHLCPFWCGLITPPR